MPKIIENLREQITQEAKRQLFSQGYVKTTIRSVASACGIGVGTVYNYFSSKELMISAFMLDDWHECIGQIHALDKSDFDGFFRGITSILSSFNEKYQTLYLDKDARKVFSMVSNDRHTQLRNQLAEIISPMVRLPECRDDLCNEGVDRFDDAGCFDDAHADEDSKFLTEYIAESIIYWTMRKTPIDRQLLVLRKLLL
ncbi:MAG: TetR/AcrR family transcriptional regulator [Butyrivibrio sp.]|nr:TetR/AcrR family transcriptional regulator [Butyrivibrio sp.]